MSSPVRDADREVAESMLVRYLEAADAGAPITVARLCDGRADLVPALTELIALAGGFVDGSPGDPWLGRRLDERYELTRRLGMGGMGVVYEATDHRLARVVAVKVLEDLFHDDPDRLERFRREARALAALENPNIVAVHDVGLGSEPPYLVMEHIAGFDLGRLLRELAEEAPAAALPDAELVARTAARLAEVSDSDLDDAFRRPWPELVARWGVQMCRALEAAHDAGIVHRDVKPSNFMLDAAGRVRLLDFGIARRELDPALTRGTSWIGTPHYMSPEQVRGGAATAASDIYGLGATLYHCTCLRPPFDATGHDLATRVLYDEPAPPRSVRRGLARDLEAVCLAAMHKRPDGRYESATAVRDDLERFLRYEAVHARPRILPAPLRAAIGTCRRYRPVLPVLGGAAVVALLAVLSLSNFIGDVFATSAIERTREIQRLVRAIPPSCGLWGTADERRACIDDDVRRLGELLELDPTHVEARFLRWRLLAERDGGSAASQDHAALLAAIGGETLARFQAAFDGIRDRRERPEGVREVLSSLGPLPDRADLSPLWHRLYLMGLLVLQKVREADEVVAGFEATLPEGIGGTALTSFVRATVLYARQRYDSALPLYEASDALAPGQPPTLHGIARALLHLDRLAEAETRIVDALALSSSHFNLHELYIRILRRQGRLDAAEQAVAAIPAAFPRHGDLALGNVLFDRALRAADAPAREGYLGAAERLFRGIVEDATALRRLRATAARNLRIVAGERSGDVGAILDAVRREPLEPLLLANLGRHLLGKGRRWADLGKIHLLQALMRSPSDPHLVRLVARALAERDPAAACGVLCSHLQPESMQPGDAEWIRGLAERLTENDRGRWVPRLADAGLWRR